MNIEIRINTELGTKKVGCIDSDIYDKCKEKNIIFIGRDGYKRIGIGYRFNNPFIKVKK